MTELQNKITKSSKVIGIVFKVLRITTYVAIGVVLASMLFTFAAGSGVYEISDGAKIMTGLSFNGEPIVSVTDLVNMLPVFISALVWSGLMLCIFYIAGALFKDIQITAMPFTDNNVQRIRRIAKLLIAIAIAPAAAQLIAMFSMGIDGSVEDVVDMTSLVVALIFFCVARIFEYGAALQQQADETL